VHSRYLLILPLLGFCIASAQDYESKLKPPLSKREQDLKYHKPDVIGTDVQARLRSYEHRLQMERDSPFAGIKWRNVGPERQGGRVVEILSPQNKPGTFLVAYATGGLWRSEDEGYTWESLFDHEGAFSIGSVAANKDGTTIWIGTGENNSQRTSYSGIGAYKSIDSGRTWKNMGLCDTHRIGKVVIDPDNENTVYVGALGPLYSEGAARGVYKTTDGGATWKQVLQTDPYTGIIDVVMDPRHHETLYAATWDRDRRAWDFREGGPGTAIYKSKDGGRSWIKLQQGLPNTADLGRIGLAISPSRPDTLYAFVNNQAPYKDTMDEDEFQPSGVLTPHRFLLLNEEQFAQVPRKELERFFSGYLPKSIKLDDVLQKLKDKKMTLDELRAAIEKANPDVFVEDQVLEEVYRSDDGGMHWRRTHPQRLGPHGGYYWGRVFVHPQNPDEVYTAGVIMLKSTDGGRTWAEVVKKAHSDFHVYYIDPRNPRLQAVGTDGGIYFSLDSGGHWRHVENVSVGQFTTIAVDNKTPYNIYGGLQDNGTIKGPSTHKGGEGDPNEWTYVGWGDGSAVAVDPRDDGDVIYTASQFGQHQGQNQKTGDRWRIRPSAPDDQPPLRFNWISPILISPHHPDIIYLGSQKLHRSLDKGKTWEDLSGDLTRNLPNGNVPFSTIKDISESPFKFGLVYIGADDGTVKVTKDHGATWTDIATPAKNKWVTRLVASKWDKATVYVAQSGYRDDDFQPYLWRSTDYGAHWTSIVGDLPLEPINVVREDPNRKDMLYVGTDMGIFVTTDVGARWLALPGGLPHTPVHDLAIQARDKELVAASHARSVWVLKLDQLYALDKGLQGKELYVYPLETMHRSRSWGYGYPSPETDTAPPAPELHGQLWTNKPGKAVIRLIGKDGKVVKEQVQELVRGFNSFAISLQLSPSKRGVAAVKGRPIKTLEDILKDPYESERPGFIAAGTYSVEITVNGLTSKESWTLEPPG
jgi:photosystem II stability/assembly factor-like uncharacterized protein